MKITRLFTTASILCFWTVCVTAQEAVSDPFGAAGPVSDPFAGGKTVDPFAGAVADPNDPFGVPKEKPASVKATALADSQARERRRAGLSVEEVILQELAQPTTVHFVDEPLQSVAQKLSEMHQIPIVVDHDELEKIGLTPDTPISISLIDVKLRSLLNLVLRQFELTYVIRNDVLIITTAEAAKKMTTLRSYTLPESLADKSEQVLNALTTTVTPDAWKKQGGPASAAMVDHVLVVSAPEFVHESVVEFLGKLQAAFERHQAAAAH